MRSLICLVVFLLGLQFSSVSYSQDKFAACRPFEDDIARAVKKYFPQDFQYPVAFEAQIYQESLCDRFAKSGAGAEGLGQIMPGTMGDIRKVTKFSKSPFSKAALYPAAYYQGKMLGFWNPDLRTPYQRWLLSLAGYNAGSGNILKAQKLCKNSAVWAEMKWCLPSVTGRHAAETIHYVDVIPKWAGQLVDGKDWLLPPELSRFARARLIKRINAKYHVRRWFSGSAWGSYWQVWGGWISADHVHLANLGLAPPFANGSPRRAYGVVDAVVYGGSLPPAAPRQPRLGERVYIVGYPGGSNVISLRRGLVYYQRIRSGSEVYSLPAYIVKIDNPSGAVNDAAYEPVIGGMSGGLVVSEDLTALGVLTTQNSPTDLDRDGRADQSADFVSLGDIWQALQ